MKNDFTLPAEQLTVINELIVMKRSKIRSLYRQLSAPNVLDVFGEYDAMLLSQGGRLKDWLTARAFQARGNWIGKAFRPLSDQHGEGYNAFVNPSGRYGKLPMDTYIGDSLISDGNAFILDYRKKSPGIMSWLVGELRMVNSHVLLGIGHFGPRNAQWRSLCRMIPFLLIGPVRHYLGESGSTITTEPWLRSAASTPTPASNPAGQRTLAEPSRKTNRLYTGADTEV